MAGSVSFFFFLSLLFISSIHVESNGEGYISLDISNKGLDFMKGFLVEMAETSLVPLDLPKIEKSKHIPIIGTVHMVLSNISIDNIHVISSTVKAGDTGIVISVSGAYANMTMNWEYSYSSWLFPIPITDNGKASIQVEGMDVGISFNLTNVQGSLMLSPLDCGCSVKDIFIKLDGGASWLYQGLIDAFEGRLSSAVENSISKKLREGIVKIDSSLQSLPKEIPIRNIAALNVTFVGDPQFRDSSLVLSINGLISAKEAYTAPPCYHLFASLEHLLASIPLKDPASMVTISLHEKVLASASSVYYDANKMHWIVDKVPEQSLLNTAGWRFIIPQLYRRYPNADMNLNVSIYSPPHLIIKEHQIDLTVHADVVINVLNSGDVTPVACFSTSLAFCHSLSLSLEIDITLMKPPLSVEEETERLKLKAVSGSASPWISNNNLGGSIGLDELSLSLKWSKIGNLHVSLVRALISTALRTVILPYINIKLSRGYRLPTFHGYMLQNANILCSDSWIKISSDLASLNQLL
ncbi:hypothetical protein H5410_039151 [Solanum commersonii]|uniref:Lipopolysaccharide-binding protein n=1 Tax=Solanum commersonii TaxID=4109 RepID=A0A9J5YDH5_SOLCO|nr:hypothetical protein H5410_039151 [Solanum commersonii]